MDSSRKEVGMTKLLFLLCPVLFGGFCLLIGETINGFKKWRMESHPEPAKFFSRLN